VRASTRNQLNAMQLTQIAHEYLEKRLIKGAIAVDATAGNGYDTLKMAELVGSDGRVIAVDIQAAAIRATEERLNAEGFTNYQLYEADHATLFQELHDQYQQSVSAVTFNLGYLPGGDKSVRTHPESTLEALDIAVSWLNPQGILLVTAYRGHPGGKDEADLIANWMHQKRAARFSIKCYEPEGKARIPPILWVLKRPESA